MKLMVANCVAQVTQKSVRHNKEYMYKAQDPAENLLSAHNLNLTSITVTFASIPITMGDISNQISSK